MKHRGSLSMLYNFSKDSFLLLRYKKLNNSFSNKSSGCFFVCFSHDNMRISNRIQQVHMFVHPLFCANKTAMNSMQNKVPVTWHMNRQRWLKQINIYTEFVIIFLHKYYEWVHTELAAIFGRPNVINIVYIFCFL